MMMMVRDATDFKDKKSKSNRDLVEEKQKPDNNKQTHNNVINGVVWGQNRGRRILTTLYP